LNEILASEWVTDTKRISQEEIKEEFMKRRKNLDAQREAQRSAAAQKANNVNQSIYNDPNMSYRSTGDE
jgi:hypothetical protein